MEYDLDAMDMNMLNEARSVLKKRWPEMVENYLQDAAMYINNIKDGFSNDEKQVIAANAHPLKSSSNCMGLISLGEIAKKMEHNTKDAMENGDDIEDLRELIPLLEEALKRAEPKLRNTIKDTT